MPAPRTSRHPRPRVLAGLTAVVTALALLLTTGGAAAGSPSVTAAPTTAGGITVAPATNVDGLPAASGTPDVLIDAESPFTVTATLDGGVYSLRDETLLMIESSSGGLSGTTTATVPAGGTTATFSGLRLEVANAVVLTVRPVDRKAARELGEGSSAPFDVVTDTELVEVDAGDQPLVVTKSDVPCTPTPEELTCVDVLLPAGLVTGNVFFSTGSCDGLRCTAPEAGVLQVLADIQGRYEKDAPATLVFKCDKSLCGGGAIQRNVLRASLEPTGALDPVDPCPSKGVIGEDQASCVDYVQSKRDGSGDTYLYWLVTRDARLSF